VARLGGPTVTRPFGSPWEIAVKPILFLLMLIMIAGSIVVYVANEMVGYEWAEQVCSFYNVCNHFFWLLAATVIAIVLFISTSMRA
jgi:hypothetical protein